MRSNAEFGKFLYNQKPQSKPSLLALYNYIRTSTNLESKFSAEVIAQFYIKALSFEHWEKNALELSQNISGTVFQFLGDEYNSREWTALRGPEEIQIIRINNPKDQLEIIKEFIRRTHTRCRINIFSDKNKIVHAVLTTPEGGLIVRSFDDRAFIRNGAVVPLIQDRILYYDSNLELVKNIKQRLQISAFVSAQFEINDDMILGEYIRGFTLQSFKKVELHGFQQDSNILYSIKKIERFFIDRGTEPLYVELIGVLEKTLEHLHAGTQGSLELGKKAYIRGQNALQNIFVDDKMLEVLLNEIKDYIGEPKDTPWNQRTISDSINTFPNLASAPDEELIS